MKKGLLSIIVLWIAITIQAAATSGSCGTNATWEYDEWYHMLSIEGTGAIKDYKSSSLPPWHQYKDDIKTIYIEEGITELGNYAFWECENVEYVDIPLSLKRIGMNAFAYCKKLDDVIVYNNLTTIEGQAFMFCENLTSIILPNSVTNFGTTIFSGCKTLSNVVLPKNITSIPYHTFQNCWALTQIDIPSTVESIGDAAFFNSGITSIQLPANLKTIESRAFKGCDDIISLTVPDQVTEIGNQFVYDCNSLQTVTIGKSVTKIGYDAFQACDVLNKVIFKPTTPPALDMNSNFKGVPSSIQIVVPCGALNAYQTAYANQTGISSSNFVEDCGSSPGEGSLYEVTCQEAINIAKQLSNNSKTVDLYAVHGYVISITEQINKMDLYYQLSMYIADSKNGNNMLFVEKALNFSPNNLPQVGDYVLATGYLSRSGTTYKIVEGLVSKSTPPQPTLPADGSVLTCAEAAYYASQLDHNTPTTQTYIIYGYITETDGVVSRNQQTFWMADTKTGGKVFEIYGGNVSEQLHVWDFVKCQGHLMRYNSTPEMKNPDVTLITCVHEDIDEATVKDVQCTKYLRDGQILILRGDKTYTLTGQAVNSTY